jgi:hypothetical protein
MKKILIIPFYVVGAILEIVLVGFAAIYSKIEELIGE